MVLTTFVAFAFFNQINATILVVTEVVSDQCAELMDSDGSSLSLTTQKSSCDISYLRTKWGNFFHSLPF